jgi:diadenosine tetraphosphate (Ap4A) HIT family hydrolase
MYDKNNVFAKIITGEIPAEKLYEDDGLIIIKDAYPTAPTHLLAIPKNSYLDFEDFSNNANEQEIAHYFRTISKFCVENDIKGYRLVSNKGATAGQSVFHFHTHILSGSKNNELIDKNL